MSRNGFAPIVILFIIALASLTLFGYSKNNPKNNPSPNPSIAASESLIPSPTAKTTVQAKKTATPSPKASTTPTANTNTTVATSTPFPSLGPFTSIFSPTPSPSTSSTSYLISVSSTSVVVTISRSGSPAGTLAYGSGFTITNKGATGFQIKYNEPTQGKGFYLGSGGLQPNASVNVPTYINTNNPNGTYTGSAIVQYNNGTTWVNGPTVSYTIQLTD